MIMSQARFEAVWYEGEMNERCSEWQVVEWNKTYPNGGRSGRCVKSFPDDFAGERDAREIAVVLQEEYNIEFYTNFG
jgi:predicted AAA+ superfamily ATPase